MVIGNEHIDIKLGADSMQDRNPPLDKRGGSAARLVSDKNSTKMRLEVSAKGGTTHTIDTFAKL